MKINSKNTILLLGLNTITSMLCSVPIETHKIKSAELVSIPRENEVQKLLQKPVMLITIPKSGTHLLEKSLYLMDSKIFCYNYHRKKNFLYWWKKNKSRSNSPLNHWKGNLHPLIVPKIISYIKSSYSYKKTAYRSHLYYNNEYDKFLNSKNFRKILLLRDPRAVLVSFANMVKDGFESDHYIDFEDLLLDLIDGRQKHYIPWAASKHSAYPFIWKVGMFDFYKKYLPFIDTKNCLIVRFENLVGAKGGGSDEFQAHEIKLIAQHVGLALDDTKVAEIMRDLFGESATFYQGTVDGWKKYFTPTIKEAFKNVPGADELLIALGYEKDTNW